MKKIIAIMVLMLISSAHAAEKKQPINNEHRLSIGVSVIRTTDAIKAIQKSNQSLDQKRFFERMPHAGYYVLECFPNGPAYKAGIRIGDIIADINGKFIRNKSDMIFKKGKNQLLTSVYSAKAKSWKPTVRTVTPVDHSLLFETIARVEHDEINGITRYIYPTSPKVVSSRKAIVPEIITKNGNASIYLEVRYVAAKWIFLHKVTFYNPDTHYKNSITWKPLAVHRDNSAYRIWEWADSTITLDQLKALVKNSDNLTIRYDGNTYYDDIKLGDEDREALVFALGLYNELTKKSNSSGH